MIFLQIDPTAASNNLLQYGVLGAFSVLLIAALIFIFKMLFSQMEKRMERLQADLDFEKKERAELSKQFHQYQAEDREKIVLILTDVQRVLTKVDNKL